jgi:phage terminase large subunit
MDISLPNDFTPRDYQRRFMRAMDRGCRKAVWIVHRRGGKDLTALHQTCKMMHQRVGTYWHIFPSFAQARKAIWEGFTKDGKRILENVFPGFLDPKRAGSISSRWHSN